MFTNDIIGNSHAEDGTRRSRPGPRCSPRACPPAKEMSDDVLRTLVRTGGENDLPPRQLARFIKERRGARTSPACKVRVVYRRDRYLRGGDHSPFLDAGYAAVRFTEPDEDFKHQHQNVRVEDGVQYGDLPEFVDFAYIAEVARVNAAALAALALAPARAAAACEIETVKLENDTTLRWDANTEPDLAGYRIVWRETTAPLWQNRKDVGNVTHGHAAAVQGQRGVRRAGGRQGRQRQRRELPHAAPAAEACAGCAGRQGAAGQAVSRPGRPGSGQGARRAAPPARAGRRLHVRHRYLDALRVPFPGQQAGSGCSAAGCRAG